MTDAAGPPLMTEEYRAALARVACRRRAELMVADLLLAADECPEVIRELMAKALGLAPLVAEAQAARREAEGARRAAAEAYRAAYEIAAEARELQLSVGREVENLERRMDVILYEFERAEKRAVRFHRLLDDLMGAAPGNGAPAKAEGVKR